MTDNFRQNPHDEEQRKFDPFSHAVTSNDEESRMTHDGFLFFSGYNFPSVADQASVDVLVQAGPKPTHIRRLNNSATQGPLTIDIYEGTTFSAAGTVVPSQNANRRSSNTADLILSTAPTITDVGTLVTSIRLLADTPIFLSSVFQSSAGLVNEIILAADTDYLVRITNEAGLAVEVDGSVIWYEIGYDQ